MRLRSLLPILALLALFASMAPAEEQTQHALIGTYEYLPAARMADPAARLYHLTLEQRLSGIPLVLAAQRDAVRTPPGDPASGGDPERLRVEPGMLLLVEGRWVEEETTRLVYVEREDGGKPVDANHEQTTVRYFLAESHRTVPAPGLMRSEDKQELVVSLDTRDWPLVPEDVVLRFSWASDDDGSRMALERVVEIGRGTTQEFRLDWPAGGTRDPSILLTNLPVSLSGESFRAGEEMPAFALAIGIRGFRVH